MVYEGGYVVVFVLFCIWYFVVGEGVDLGDCFLIGGVEVG